MATTYAITGEDTETGVVENLGTAATHHDAGIYAAEVAERESERRINLGVENVHWENADGGWRYEVWSSDGLVYTVWVEEVEGDN